MLSIGIQYLTGYAVATDIGDRNRAEWPPHPGRVFMALAAAYFETRPDPLDQEGMDDWKAEADVLTWLETLPPPALRVSEKDERSIIETYVPPNDMGANKITIIPTLRTNRQPRTFPKVRPHNDSVWLIWIDAEPSPLQKATLSRLCRKVVRIGHSSSLVQMWIDDSIDHSEPNLEPLDSPLGRRSDCRLRIIGPGCLDYLSKQYNGQELEVFYDLTMQIESSKGKSKNDAKARFQEHFGVSWKRGVLAPNSRRPLISATQAYSRMRTDELHSPLGTFFDPDLLILTQQEGPILGLESTWRVLTALRGVIETYGHPTPEWVSGHQSDGKPSKRPHLALLPLAFVDQEHADGHLMGIALAFPNEVDSKCRGQFVGSLLYDTSGQSREIRLTLGKLGIWTLRQEDRSSPPYNVQSDTWTHPSEIWASISPVVLDQHPKADPMKDRLEYIHEVRSILAQSCRRVGLPEPEEIDFDKASWCRGVPRAKPGADGYPLMPIRPGGPNRRQVHVWLRFARPVIGPVAIGAGRYRGYGFCRPLSVHGRNFAK